MSHLHVRDSARLTCAFKCASTRAIHRMMLGQRHDALLSIFGVRFSAFAASRVPPLNFADPGDLFVIPQVTPPCFPTHVLR
jgi:hypothetical protein